MKKKRSGLYRAGVTGHAPEPWRYSPGIGIVCDAFNHENGGDGANLIYQHDSSHRRIDADGERLVACVNACAGIPNPEPLPTVIKALKYIHQNCTTFNGPDEELRIYFADMKQRDKFIDGLDKLLTDLGVS